jgi:hypothetical protein
MVISPITVFKDFLKTHTRRGEGTPNSHLKVDPPGQKLAALRTPKQATRGEPRPKLNNKYYYHDRRHLSSPILRHDVLIMRHLEQANAPQGCAKVPEIN